MLNTKVFKTRTIMDTKKYPSVDGYWSLALDIGYSAVKGISPNQVFCFPAYARKLTNSLLSFAEATDEDILYKNEAGEIWAVGSMAQNMISINESKDSEIALYGRNRYFSPMFLVIARVGFALGMFANEYGSPNGKTVTLQTGLPPKYRKNDSIYIKEVLSGTHDFYVKVGNEKWQHFCFELPSSNIDVIDQPMGTLFSISTNKEGKQIPEAKKYFGSNVLIFDPGFGTLDVFSIRNRSIDSTETFDDLGMKRVLEETSKRIFDKFHMDIPVPAMQESLKTGVVRCMNRKLHKTTKEPFADLLEESNKLVCNEALDRISTMYNDLFDYDYLVITGGTGAAWSEMIRKYFAEMDNLTIISGNQNDDLPFIFANVRGYYMFQINRLQKISSK